MQIIVDFGNESVSTPIWTQQPQIDFGWRLGSVNIGESLGELSSGWKIRFEALTKQGQISFDDNVAIDDIAFTNCNPEDHLRPLRCDFENGWCGWSNVIDNQLNWTRAKKKDEGSFAGPPGDQLVFFYLFFYLSLFFIFFNLKHNWNWIFCIFK